MYDTMANGGYFEMTPFRPGVVWIDKNSNALSVYYHQSDGKIDLLTTFHCLQQYRFNRFCPKAFPILPSSYIGLRNRVLGRRSPSPFSPLTGATCTYDETKELKKENDKEGELH
jgi:hypothetical protein